MTYQIIPDNFSIPSFNITADTINTITNLSLGVFVPQCMYHEEKIGSYLFKIKFCFQDSNLKINL